MKKSVLLIQPHSDDALFSTSSVLLKNQFDNIKILTVENNPKRIQEDLKLIEFIPNLKIETLDVDYIDHSHYTYFKIHKSMEEEFVMEHLIEVIGEAKLIDISSRIIKYIEKEKKADKSLVIYSPLGIGHPFHWLVNQVVKEYSNFFYREWPHSYKRRNKASMEEKLEEYKLAYTDADLEVHEMKFEIAKKVYKSQSSLLFFEQGHIKKQYSEEFYRL